MKLGTLLILPGLPIVRTEGGGLIVTKKFLEGMRSYAERWPGRVVAWLNETTQVTNNLDNVEVPGGLPFEIDSIGFGPEVLQRIDQRGDITCVLGGPHYLLHGLPFQLRGRGIVSVMCSEYTLRTRLDVMRSETRNPLRMLRRAVWEVSEELLTMLDVVVAHGIQCNGTPTFNRYQLLNGSAHLYFDSRAVTRSFASPEDQELRLERLRSKAQLHLAFSGRLLKMKGAHHLVPIVQALRRRGVNFRMTICGDGPLAKPIKRSIDRLGLSACVGLAGTLDYEHELVPMLREDVDLFVAPHVQGDPSCTYLETLACGVPIVGYANEAWRGLLGLAPVGWGSAVGKPDKLAELIAGLKRHEIAERSGKALGFAQRHSFERTFSRRINHLVSLACEHRQPFNVVRALSEGHHSLRGNGHGQELPGSEAREGPRDEVLRR